MKKYILTFAAISLIFTSLTSCKDARQEEEKAVQLTNQVDQSQQDTSTQERESKELEDTQVVPSGTYTGEAIIVDPQEKEIYVRLNDTTTIELYFSNDTRVMRNNQQVGFEALQKGQTVEVEVEKSGESLQPKSVRIVE